MGRYLKGAIDEGLTIGALATKDVVAAAFDETVNERTRVSSIVATYVLADLTPSVDDGPIFVGVAHGDYSATEIEEFLEATGSWNEGDLVEQEIAKRKIRRIGIFDEPTVDVKAVRLNDGVPIRTKLNWILNQGQGLQLWAYNLGAGGITTGATVHVAGHANLWPQ